MSTFSKTALYYDARKTPECTPRAYVVHSQRILRRVKAQQDANPVIKVRLLATTEVGKQVLHKAAASLQAASSTMYSALPSVSSVSSAMSSAAGPTASSTCDCLKHAHNCKPARRSAADYKHAFITTMLAVASIASLMPAAQANPMHSAAMNARGTAFALCPACFAGIDPILLNPRRPGTNPYIHTMPNAPPGWKWRSALVDFSCIIHLLPYKAIYNAAHTTASNVRICTADDSVKQVQFTGPATVHTYDAQQRPISLLTKSHYCPKLAPLISAHALAEAKCTVHISERSSHAKLPGGRIVRFRRDGHKDWLDILVPQSTNKSSPRTECQHHAQHTPEHAFSASRYLQLPKCPHTDISYQHFPP